MVYQRYKAFLSVTFVSFALSSVTIVSGKAAKIRPCCRIPDRSMVHQHSTLYCGKQFAALWGEAVRDIFSLHFNLISWDSFKIISAAFPFFIATRMIDEKLQDHFYDRCSHKNRRQLPRWCHDIAQYGIGIPIVYFGARGIFDKDPEWQAAGRVYLIGMPFVIFGKDVAKSLRFDICLRPWSEDFSRHHRSLGGFPSGHMAEAMYTSVLFGRRFGWKYGLPLGIMTGLIGLTFLNCNRHYISQLVAGATLGFMYALAADKVIEKRLSNSFRIGLTSGSSGEPNLSLSFTF